MNRLHQTLLQLRWRGRVCLALLALLVGGLLWLLASAGIASYRYNLPFASTALARSRHVALTIIHGLVAVWDPYCPRRAALGPSDADSHDWRSYQRIEEALARSVATDSSQLHLLAANNARIVQSDFPFAYQPHDEPRLHQLRQEFKLDEVVAGASDELEELVRLRNWARSQFQRRDYQPLEPNFDALAVLRRNLRNPTDRPLDLARDIDPCKFFPLLYTQVLLSMGHQARIVSSNHGMAEVWSNQFGKWMLMDAELNLDYRRQGVPLSGLELRAAVIAGQTADIDVVLGEQTSGDISPTMIILRTTTLRPGSLINGRVPFDIADLRNDWLTNHYFRGHPARSDAMSLTFNDAAVDEEFRLLYPLRPLTTDPNQFHWTLNQAEIYADKPTLTSESELNLIFHTHTPNFHHFDVSIDNQPPQKLTSSTFSWQLHPGANKLSVKPVNAFGVKGIESSLELQLLTEDSSAQEICRVSEPREAAHGAEWLVIGGRRVKTIARSRQAGSLL